MVDLLPNSLRDISEAIGFEKEMLIVQNYGGQRIWVPKQVTLDWGMLLVVGYEDGYKLVQYFGGCQFVVPLCEGLRIQTRNEQIRRDRGSMSIAQLVAKYHLGDRQIRKILNRHGA